jgi:A/G-specific adenine glycosylase
MLGLVLSRYLVESELRAMQEHGGQFPRSAAALQQLPGIGPSTAAAIASFCWEERVAILDGNVKRVLARVLAFGGDLAQPAQERALWTHAQALLPDDRQDMPRYTQGMMDLGATVCLARSPNCLLCPVQDFCEGRRTQKPEIFPVRTRKLRRTAESLWLLRARSDDGAVWLQRRPAPGVWAGLYCLPVFASRDALTQAVPRQAQLRDQPGFLHVLTHKDLHLHPVEVTLRRDDLGAEGAWFGAAEWPALGLPAPVRKLLAA